MAGVRHIFLYGTLLDPDVLRLALGGAVGAKVEPSRLVGARLADYRRGYIVGRDFPGLKAEQGHETSGMVLCDVSTRERLLFNAYEGPNYRLTAVEALLDADPQRSMAAHAYVVKPGLKIDAPWDLKSWQTHHKPAYMQRWFG